MSDGDDRRAELAALGLRAASLVHEIRQPLFVLRGVVDLALGGPLRLGPEELHQLRQELLHLEALVEFYGAPRLAPGPAAPLDLPEAVAQAVSSLGSRARAAGVSVRAASGGAVVVRARSLAVRQVVVNLVSNAIDAAASGGRTVTVTTRGTTDGAAVVEVVDDGPGIDPSVVDRLAEPFVTSKAPGAGSGLGLFIVRQLAAEWGGALAIGAGPGDRGACVAVSFPAPAGDQR